MGQYLTVMEGRADGINVVLPPLGGFPDLEVLICPSKKEPIPFKFRKLGPFFGR